MKTVVKRAIRDEKGAALALALVLLVVGGLILTPLLGLMSTGLLAGQVYEKKAHEYYAADSGVEDAIWKITHNETLSYPYQYDLTAGGKAVGVAINRTDWDETCGENLTYQIISMAATDASGSTAATDTRIDAQVVVSYMDLGNLLDNALVSDNFIWIANGVNVTGNVTSGGDVEDHEGVPGPVNKYAELDWPSSEDLKAYYLDDVDQGTHYYGDTFIDLEGNSCPPGPIYVNSIENHDWPSGLGPLYIDGELDATSSDQQQDVILKLTGTLYITGDTEISGPSNKEPYRLTLDLNGQTIFVASPSSKSNTPPDAQPALSIANCHVTGSGCIIAVGDVFFAPKGDVGNEHDFVLVMSVEGNTDVHPSGVFHGCIAGALEVQMYQGTGPAITNTDWESADLNFPVGFDPNRPPPITGVSIAYWNIS